MRSRVRASEEGEDFADGGFPAGGLAEPTSTQRDAFDLIGAPIPLALK